MALSTCSGKERESPDGCHQSLSLCSLGKPRDLTPCHELLLTEPTIVGSAHQVSATTKQVVDRTMNGEKTLSLSSRLAASHLPFALAIRLTGDLSPIV